MEKYDLIVVGGGWSGSSAAISAAREGLKVLIIDKYSSLGGSSSLNNVIPFMPFVTKVNNEIIELSQGIFREIRERLVKKNGLKDLLDPFFNQEILKIVLDEMVEEAGIDVLFHTYLIGANVDNGIIKSIKVTNESGISELEAKVFVDATGNADLCELAHVPTILGRESDNLCQPMTLIFWLSNVNVPLAYKEKAEINKKYAELQKEGKINNPRENILFSPTNIYNVMHFNTTRVVKLNPVDALDKSKAEIIARKQIIEIYDFLKNNFEAFKDSQILFIAPEIGIRESRKLIGEHVLNEIEIKNCTKFEDGIAACNYDIDIHNPDGTGTSHYYFKPGEYYTIPYRCLYNKQFPNLLVSGRCISATHEAQASMRIMPTCSCIGEATGIAASLMVNNDLKNSEIDTNKLRELLLKNKAFIDQI